MRPILLAGVTGCLLLLAGGCRPWWKHESNPPFRPNTESPTQATLLRAFNDNAARIKSIEASLDIDAAQGGQQIGGTGVLACQEPRNFRLQGKFIVGQADIGSNDQEFWYWISKAEPPYLFYCNYADLNAGKVALPFPFQPEWIMEAFGMSELDLNGQYQLRDGREVVELIQTVKTPQGHLLRKAVIFNKSSINAGRPQVVAFAIRTEKDQDLFVANVKSSQYDKANGALLPRKVQLIAPGEKPNEKVSLMLTLGDVRVNGRLDNSASLFARPQWPNVQSYDLARRQIDQPTSYVQRAGGGR